MQLRIKKLSGFEDHFSKFHLFRILCQRQLQQLVGTMDGIVDVLKFLSLDGIEKFLPPFLVGNPGGFCIEVVCQIARCTSKVKISSAVSKVHISF